MKKLIAIACISAMMLCGCQKEAAYMKPYTVVTSGSGSNMASMLHTEAFDGFAKDLGVVSIADNDAGVGEGAADYNAIEVFLTGTTDNQVMTSYQVFKQMPPASITKILTALMALKYGGDLEQKITLTDAVKVSVWDAQVCGFEAGDVVTLKQLIYAMLVYSGNDAANAIAYTVGNGSISDFCKQMTEEAHKLGATQTNFVTPNGLDDPDHYTTAYDLYLIFNECLKYDVFKDAISQSSYTATYVHNGENVTQTWPTTNYYLLGNKNPPDGVTVVGGKTGTTDNAGLCLILYVEDKDGNGYVSVMLGCPNKDTLYASMSKLLSNICK